MLVGGLLFASCGGDVESKKISEYVKPVADFMNGTPGVQLFSYFDQETYKEEKVTLNGQVCTTGSYGKSPVIYLCDFEQDGVKFQPYIVVSEEDRTKVQESLKAAEKEGKEDINIVFEGKLVKKGSDKSPFGGQIKLKFDEGKVIKL